MAEMKILTPPPTPFPTCGRLPVAFPLQGRGAAAALPAAQDSVGTPLPCRGGVGGGVSNIRIGYKNNPFLNFSFSQFLNFPSSQPKYR